MTGLLAIDPGKHRSGWALFQGDQLYLCGFDAPFSFNSVTRIAVEIPVVRRAGKSKGNPGDLIQLALVAGIWVGMHPNAEVTQHKPEAWKGQTPKSVVHERALVLLDDIERCRLGGMPTSRADRANTWDAVAIGLFHLGRLR